VIIQLVRHKRLEERYAMLWILAGFLMLFAPWATPLIDFFSLSLGIHYPPAFVFLLVFFALGMINLQFSVTLSRLSKQNKILAQKLAILEEGSS
jgi:Uncharacterized conserved protein (DUF2304).